MKKRERLRTAAREGREIEDRSQSARDAAKRQGLLRAVLRLLGKQQRKAERAQIERVAETQGVSVNGLLWRQRYQSDPLWREQQRLRSRDKKLRRASGIEAASDGSLTPAALVAMFAAAKSCPFCHKRMRSQDKSLDHIVPLSKGGAHSVLNTLVCCKRCNAKKHARPIASMLTEGQQLPLIAA